MPELPEVETTRRGLKPLLLMRQITAVNVYNRRLRRPITKDIAILCAQRRVVAIERRGKYLLLTLDSTQTLLIHLGMSGSLRVTDGSVERRLHDHIEWQLDNNQWLRFNDPRRFGLVELLSGDPLAHPWLSHLGPEPLTRAFNAEYLFALTRNRQVAIKLFIMNASMVVGVGNIYASEALFEARIGPMRAAKSLTLEECVRIISAIQKVLKQSIRSGGTTLRDYLNPQGDPGYFRQKLSVYERQGQACYRCDAPIQSAVLAQRSTYWCPQCQSQAVRRRVRDAKTTSARAKRNRPVAKH